ncbi:hypothetical protein [Carboxylicivirga sp. N1Y90]|uniref:hypothetical protein n=1 Tax=Carboxylicivirga fragile TaxID=3417571 RepID=UPI003D32D4DF|nr:hypothetical protein [Marinilabiliaceae bacterium N1Y90]
MPKIFQCTKQASLYLEQYSEKQPEHGLNILSGYRDIQKSHGKQSQALKIYSTTQLFSMFKWLFHLFPNLNPEL